MAELIAVTGATGGMGGRVARRLAAGSSAPDWEVEGWVRSYAAIAGGELDLVTDTVRRLAGHDPMGLADWIEAHPEALKPAG